MTASPRPAQGARAHAERPEGDQSQLHLVTRPPPCRKAPSADAEGQARAHRRNRAISQAHHLTPGRKHGHLQEGAKKPEPRHAERRHPQRALARQTPHAGRQPCPRVPAQRRRITRGRDPWDTDAHRRTEPGHCSQCQTNRRQVLIPDRVERSASRRAEDDRCKRAHLEQAVSPRQRTLGHDLRERCRTWRDRRTPTASR